MFTDTDAPAFVFLVNDSFWFWPLRQECVRQITIAITKVSLTIEIAPHQHCAFADGCFVQGLQLVMLIRKAHGPISRHTALFFDTKDAG